MTTGESKAESEVRIADEKVTDDEGKVVTIKLDFRGPAEFVSWMRENRPRRAGMFPRISSLLPSGAREHVINAQREQLLAVRSVVDSVLDAMINRLEHAGEKPERKATKVDVD